MAIQFTKMSGSGNDFIVIDNRVPVMEDSKKCDFVRRVCDRKMSIGADGVIITAASNSDDIISISARISRKKGRIILVVPSS